MNTGWAIGNELFDDLVLRDLREQDLNDGEIDALDQNLERWTETLVRMLRDNDLELSSITVSKQETRPTLIAFKNEITSKLGTVKKRLKAVRHEEYGRTDYVALTYEELKKIRLILEAKL